MFRHFLTIIKFLLSSEKGFYGSIKNITGFYPQNISYYHLAFQHKSLLRKDSKGHYLNNERLEFLGDAILGATIAHDLFLRFPYKDEGGLTKIRSRIVNRHNMNQIAMNMGLDKLIQTQPLIDLAQTHIPGDTLEALIGAIYMDCGEKKAKQFIHKKILSKQIDFSKIIYTDTNYKSLLIEWGQKNKCEVHFMTEEYHYPVFDRETFIAKAYIDGTLIGDGTGASKKEAQQNAAYKAIQTVSDSNDFLNGKLSSSDK